MFTNNGKVNTRPGSPNEGLSRPISPEVARMRRIEAAAAALEVALANTYPDVIVPDTIAAETHSSDPVRSAAASRAASSVGQQLVQQSVAPQSNPELN